MNDYEKGKFFRTWLCEESRYSELQNYGYVLMETKSPTMTPIIFHIHNIKVRIFLLSYINIHQIESENDPCNIKCILHLTYKNDSVKQFITLDSIPNNKIKNDFPCFEDLFKELVIIGKYIKTQYDCKLSKGDILDARLINNENVNLNVNAINHVNGMNQINQVNELNEKPLSQLSIDKITILNETFKMLSQMEQIEKTMLAFEFKINKRIQDLEHDVKSCVIQFNKKLDKITSHIAKCNDNEKSSNFNMQRINPSNLYMPPESNSHMFAESDPHMFPELRNLFHMKHDSHENEYEQHKRQMITKRDEYIRKLHQRNRILP